MLENIIEKGKTLKLEENEDSDEEEPGEMTVFCVTCGANVQIHTAIRHMERCYNKVYSQFVTYKHLWMTLFCIFPD